MNWKKLVYFLSMTALVGTALGTVVYFGLSPKSVPKINLSHFDTPAAAGEAVGQRLWLELKAAPVLLFGVWPDKKEDVEAVAGFLAHFKGPDLKYDVVFVEPNLPFRELLPNAQEVSLRDQLDRVVEVAKAASAQGQRVIAVVPSMFSSRLLTDGPAARLKAALGETPFVAISTSPFPYTRDEEKEFPLRCDAGNDPTGYGQLTCAVIQKSRVTYRKKKDPSKYNGSLDLVGENDYLFLFSAPR